MPVPDERELPPPLFDTIDRLTIEMGLALREGDTRVVWLLDRSGSLRERREIIAQKMPTMVRAAAQIGAHNLETVVVGYGADCDVFLQLQESRSDIAVRRLSRAFRDLPADETGRENTFSALIQTASNFAGITGNPLGKEVLFFVVTDEPGDDPHLLEDAIATLNAGGVRCSIAGHLTPFLSTRRFVNWTYEDGFSEGLPIDAGIESALPQRVFHLPLSPVDPREIPSGFGPWALTRLCAETGGSYLVDWSEYEYELRFSVEAMEEYTPGTGRRLEEFVNELIDDPARRALVDASRLASVTAAPEPALSFSAENDKSLTASITSALRAAAVSEFHLTQIYGLLLAFGDQEALADPRSQADYNLSMARVHAARVRMIAYQLQLVAMQSDPMQLDDGRDEWRLVPAPIRDWNATLLRVSRLAETDLQRVIDEHPGTPWAAAAKRELAAPWGWRWEQSAPD